MSTTGFIVSHARDAKFDSGLRAFCDYRDLGIKAATNGRVVAHVIRAVAGSASSAQPHLHRTEFQLVYVLKGWIEFEYEGQGIVRLEAGSFRSFDVHLQEVDLIQPVLSQQASVCKPQRPAPPERLQRVEVKCGQPTVSVKPRSFGAEYPRCCRILSQGIVTRTVDSPSASG